MSPGSGGRTRRRPSSTRAGTTLRPRVEVLDGAAAIAASFGALLSAKVAEAIERRGRATIAFSRPTPEEVFRPLGDTVRLPKGRVDVFQADERHAEVGSTDRNATLLRDHIGALLDGTRFEPVPAAASADESAERYAVTLEERCGRPPVLDLVHLGLGPDGHTASLLPDDPVLEVDDRWVAATGEAGGFARVTFTYPVIDMARTIVFVATGKAKAAAVGRVLGGDRAVPAARIENADVIFLLDPAAASEL